MVAEAGDVDDLAEQLPEEEQPDRRLDHAEGDDDRLADQRVQLAAGQVPGVGDGTAVGARGGCGRPGCGDRGHARVTSAISKRRPA